MRRVFLLLLAPAAGCGRATVSPPPPVASPPVPVAAPAPVATAAAKTAVARGAAERVYAVRASASVERDSAGRTQAQRVETRATVALQFTRSDDGGLRGTGRIDAFTVQRSGAGLPAVVPSATSASATMRGAAEAFAPVSFDAVLDAQSIRVTARPPLVNECDRAESGAMTLVHDLLLRVPVAVVAGDRWRDSTSSVMCRAGIPITVRAAHEYVVESVDGRSADATVRVKRTTVTRLDGRVGTAWRALELAGTGSGVDEFRVDAATGVVQTLDGQHALTLQLTERGRSAGARSQPVTQQVTQRTTVHAEIPR